MKFFEQGRADGGDFESGIRMALQAILASPRFLFRLEQTPATARPGPNYRIADRDLASRLSFFLWGAGPDAELLKAAAQGTLKTPAVLAAQVQRMLADPKSEALATRFASQWLRLQDLEKINPDALLFPYYDRKLAEALKRETELFFNSIVREDRDVRRPADGRLHVRQRARGAALRHSQHQRLRIPARHAGRTRTAAACSARAASSR